jgi:hypothetical protein
MGSRRTIFVVFVLIAVYWGTAGIAAQSDASNPGSFSLITPYVNAADIADVPGAFSSIVNCPWGFAHAGIDFNPARTPIPFRAAASGVVDNVVLWVNPTNGNWQVNIGITIDRVYTLGYAFEMPTSSQAEGQAQLDQIFVKKGQAVRQGDIVGNLLGTHVDFGLTDGSSRISPEPFFTGEARKSILDLMHKAHPYYKLTYDASEDISTFGDRDTSFSMVTPYYDAARVSDVRPYASTNANPAGEPYDGIQFYASSGFVPFRAVTSGVVEFIRVEKPDGRLSTVIVSVRINRTYFIEYCFARFTDEEVGRQVGDIYVRVGQRVEQGDVIGYLVVVKPIAYMKLGIVQSWKKISPEPFFTLEARRSISRIFELLHPGWKMTY